MGPAHATPSAATVLAVFLLGKARVGSCYPIIFASAFSFPPTSTITRPLRTHTKCYAKLNKIASDFDLDEILSNEREFSSDDDISAPTGRGRRKGKHKDDKKKKLKEQLKKQKIGRQQSNPGQKGKATFDINDGYLSDASEGLDDGDTGIDHESLMNEIDFLAYEVPSSLDGTRVDAALVELLNEDADGGNQNAISISRSQCDRILSNQCVFVVPPEKASEFTSARQSLRKEASGNEDDTSVPFSLIEQFGSPIERKSFALEPNSILVYPSRGSLLSTATSATLLSNLLPPTEIIAQNIPLDVLFEDEHMIVINKQAGMVVHPAAGNWDGTMVNALAYYLTHESPFGAGELFSDREKQDSDPDVSTVAMSDDDTNQNDAVTNSISALRPGIVHRLDKGTTGVLVVAKTSSALATLSEAFANRTVKKEYLAVAIGNPGEDQWINKPIGRHPQHRQRMRVVPDPNSSVSTRSQPRMAVAKSTTTKQGRPALSHIHTIHYDGKLSIVQVRIATGRTHQIRVHLQDHGTPIYGDDVYGLSDWNKALSKQRGITRPLLHAQRLEIEHPVTGETMAFEAEVADDMMGVIKAIWPAGETIEL